MMIVSLGAFEVKHGGVVVSVSGIEAAQWKNLEGMLKDQLTLNGGGAVAEPLADDLAFFTRQFLIRDGWPEVEVSWKLQKSAIVLVVKTGPRVRVGEVRVQGAKEVPEEELRKFVMKPTLERESVDAKLPQWVDGDLQEGAGLVARRLRAEGYLNATALLLPAPDHDAQFRRDLTVQVTPGPRFTFGKASLSGAPLELESEMQALMTEQEGTAFNEARVQQIEQRLRSMCADHGWLNATTEARYTLSKAGGAVDVLFLVTPSERVRITRVVTHPGFSRGAARVLMAKFKPLQGQIYEAEDADFFFKRALDTGMFALLDTEVVAVDAAKSQGELHVTGEETKPHTLGFEAGFDTFLGGQAGVTYKNTNFRNKGNTLAAELSYSVAGPLGFVSHTNPAVFGSQWALTSRLALEQFNRFEYDRLGTTLGFDLVRRVSVPLSYGFFLSSSVNTVSTKNLTKLETGPQSYTLESLGANILYDQRDSPILPTKGWMVSGRLESTVSLLGGNVSFLRSDIRAAWYRPLTKKLRFATGFELSNLLGVKAEDVPIDARVFNGGPNSVRSFAQRELGPVTPGGTPLGGTSALFASAEFSYELIQNLELALFTDVGSLGRGVNASPFAYSSDLRYAVGAGLRYHLPFGPIRVDYGHNMSPRTGERGGMLHVTVGFAF
ncbi:MAG: BamA/TamA family outer membrane protein [Verrucomicrobiaceae bacterium]|nr:BamA/TamA family outer membrane protein [Verrucomicrobiaceae bacterium]